MSKVLVENSNLQNIAAAIREKNGSTDTYKPSEMATAISAINGGGDITFEDACAKVIEEAEEYEELGSISINTIDSNGISVEFPHYNEENGVLIKGNSVWADLNLYYDSLPFVYHSPSHIEVDEETIIYTSMSSIFPSEDGSIIYAGVGFPVSSIISELEDLGYIITKGE